MPKIVLWAVLFLTTMLPAAIAAPQDMVQPIGDIGLLAPPDPPGPGGPKFYSETGPKPNWNIAQWNIPGGALSPFQKNVSGDTTTYTASASEARLKIIRHGNDVQVDLAQDGTVLPCETAAGRPRESDFLLSPNGQHANFPGVPGLTIQGDAKMPLSRLSSVVFEAGLSVTEGITQQRKGCPVDQGSALLGVILTNFTKSHAQTMFYQLNFDQLCGIQPQARDKLCHAVHDKPLYFFRTNPFGVADFLPLLGMSFVHSQEQRQLDLDILPRLRIIVQNGPVGMDRDLSHWTVTGLYVGQAIWGDVTLASQWRNIHLLVE